MLKKELSEVVQASALQIKDPDGVDSTVGGTDADGPVLAKLKAGLREEKQTSVKLKEKLGEAVQASAVLKKELNEVVKDLAIKLKHLKAEETLCDNLEIKLKQSQSEATEVTSQLDHSDKETVRLGKELKQSQTQLAKLKGKLAKMEARAIEAESLLNTPEDEDEAKDESDEMIEVRSEIVDLTSQNEALVEEITELKKKLKKNQKASAICTELRKQLKAQQALVLKLTQQSEGAVACADLNQELQEKITKSTVLRKELESNLKTANKTVNDHAKEIRKLTSASEQNDSRGLEINAISKREQQSQREVEELTQQLVNVNDQAKILKTKVAKYKNACKELRSQQAGPAVLKNDLNMTQSSLRSFEEKHDAVQTKIAQLVKEKDEATITSRTKEHENEMQTGKLTPVAGARKHTKLSLPPGVFLFLVIYAHIYTLTLICFSFFLL